MDTGRNKPESRRTLSLQHEQVMRGHKPAMMFPKGTAEAKKPLGLQRTKTARGVFHYNPSQVSEAHIRHASRGGRENDVLGLGPYSKADIAKRIKAGEKPVAIVERTLDGKEVKAAVGTDKTALEQLAYFNRTKTKGNIVRIEHPAKVVKGKRRGRKKSGKYRRQLPGHADPAERQAEKEARKEARKKAKEEAAKKRTEKIPKHVKKRAMKAGKKKK